MASTIKCDTIQSTTSNVFFQNSAGTEYARFDSSGVFQLANPTIFPAGTALLPSITATGDTNTGLYFPAADTIGFVEGGAEVMRINSSGNVGISTSSPAAKLDIYTNQAAGFHYPIFFSADNSASAKRDYLQLGFSVQQGLAGSETGGFDLKALRNNTPVYLANYEGAAGSGTWRFYTDATERMRIDSSGNLLVGTTSAITGNAQITIVGSSTNRGALQMGRTTAATTGVAGSLVAYNGSNPICGIDWQSNGANNSGYIGTYTYNAGSFAQGPYLNTGGTNWTAASDERLKNVTGEITDALNKVSQIRAVEFTWKADTLNKPNIGFIAQDVQVVLPEVIDTDTNGHLGVRYAEVTSLLLAAIKEQQALIQSLTTRITALETP